MTITVDIEPEVEQELLAQASAHGISLTAYLEEVVVRAVRAQEAAGTSGPSAKNRGGVPPASESGG